MIRFTCELCGKSVRTRDEYVGKKGRCPACRAVINIPRPPNAGQNNVSSLAAALSETDHTPAVVPPPPRLREPEEDEFQLVDLQTSSAFETDHYPALGAKEAEAQKEEGPQRPDHPPRKQSEIPAPPLEIPTARPAGAISQRTFLIAAIVLVVVVLIAGVILWAYYMLNPFPV